MGDLIGYAVLVAVLLGLLWFVGKVTGVTPHFTNDPLDDPRVEWKVWEAPGPVGNQWQWQVSVGDESRQDYYYGKWEATAHARAAAKLMLGEGESIGRTRPCPLCGKPSQPGKETDTDECAALLVKARAELSELPKTPL